MTTLGYSPRRQRTLLIAAFCLVGLFGRLIVTVLPTPDLALTGFVTGVICHSADGGSGDPADRQGPIDPDTCKLHACCHSMPQPGMLMTGGVRLPPPHRRVVSTVSHRPPATGPPAVPPLAFHSRAPPLRS